MKVKTEDNNLYIDGTFKYTLDANIYAIINACMLKTAHSLSCIHTHMHASRILESFLHIC